MITPKFEKQNHHYVPQFWQRGFRASNGHLYARIGEETKIVSTKTTMQVDWLYTTFDEQWQPSDALEDTFSAIEGRYAQLLQRLHVPGYITTKDDKKQLCDLLALQASRHPDVLQRGHNLSRELAELLADVHGHAPADFVNLVGAYGIESSDGHDLFVSLSSRTKEQLHEELDEILQLSPQSEQLPMQDAVKAAPEIAEKIAAMDLSLLDAVAPSAFVLGDTPMAQSNLNQGFSVPLSKSLAVLATPVTSPKLLLTRRVATQEEVNQINHEQFANARDTVVGSSAMLLKNL